jgi:nitrogen fixation NifU-like protein
VNSELADLYQDLILDHNRRPRNRRKIDEADRHAVGHNPLCGDRLTLYVNLDDAGRITDIAFEGAGCAISTASASLLTEAVKGKTITEAHALFNRFHALLTGETNGAPATTAEPAPKLGKLAAFEGVRQFPMRVKCATLAWHTLEAALEKPGEATVSTE